MTEETQDDAPLLSRLLRRPRRRASAPLAPGDDSHPAESPVAEEPAVGPQLAASAAALLAAAEAAPEGGVPERPNRAPRRRGGRGRRVWSRLDPADTPAEPAEGPSPAAGEAPEAEATSSPVDRPPVPISVNVVIPRGAARRVNADLIRQVAERAVRRDGWSDAAAIDITLVDETQMREINGTRRGIDQATDVLSFPLLELRPGEGITHDFFVLPPDAVVHLGDVVIALDLVEKQAEEAGHSREREIAYLTVHGVLHILGYDHETLADRRRMRRREEEVLGELGLRRDGGVTVNAKGSRVVSPSKAMNKIPQARPHPRPLLEGEGAAPFAPPSRRGRRRPPPADGAE